MDKLIKEAHDNAIRIGAYDCGYCEGIGYLMDGDTCPYCKGSRKDPKIAVYEKIIEEDLEFLNSIPSETFNKDSEQSEISDIILVLLAYCGEMNYDIEKDIIAKMEYNKKRIY